MNGNGGAMLAPTTEELLDELKELVGKRDEIRNRYCELETKAMIAIVAELAALRNACIEAGMDWATIQAEVRRVA